MGHLNRDSLVAIFLLVFTGVFFWASFDIREPDYGVLAPSAWPRIILLVLGLLSVIMLVQSLRSPASDDGDDFGPRQDTAPPPSDIAGLIAHWRNPIFCFLAFLGFLLVLPYLGMLVGGSLFVFVLLNLLGGVSPRLLAIHALIAVLSIGAMWTLFTFGLRVILPTGSLFDGRI